MLRAVFVEYKANEGVPHTPLEKTGGGCKENEGDVPCVVAHLNELAIAFELLEQPCPHNSLGLRWYFDKTYYSGQKLNILHEIVNCDPSRIHTKSYRISSTVKTPL